MTTTSGLLASFVRRSMRPEPSAPDSPMRASLRSTSRDALSPSSSCPRRTSSRRSCSGACVVPAGCSNVVVRADVLRELGGFDERFAHVADWDLWLRLVDHVRGVACSDVLVAYVLHDANMHVVDKSSRELDELIRKHAAATPPRIVAPDLASYARWEAAQRSRAGLNVAAARVYARSALTYRSPGNILRAVDALLGKRGRAGRHAGASARAAALATIARGTRAWARAGRDAAHSEPGC